MASNKQQNSHHTSLVLPKKSNQIRTAKLYSSHV